MLAKEFLGLAKESEEQLAQLPPIQLMMINPAWRWWLLEGQGSFADTSKQTLDETPELEPLLKFRDQYRLIEDSFLMRFYSRRESPLHTAIGMLNSRLFPRGFFDAFYLAKNALDRMEEQVQIHPDTRDAYGYLFWSPAVVAVHRKSIDHVALVGKTPNRKSRSYVDYALRTIALDYGIDLVIKLMNPMVQWTTEDDHNFREFVRGEFPAYAGPRPLDVVRSPSPQRVRQFIDLQRYITEFNEAEKVVETDNSDWVSALETCIGSLLGVSIAPGKKSDEDGEKQVENGITEPPHPFRRKPVKKGLSYFLNRD